MPHRILGIDPGSRHTGIALLCEANGSLQVELCEVLHLSSEDDHTKRLKMIYGKLTEIVQLCKPTACAVETPVYGVDPLAMLKLGRAQAAAILAVSGQDVEVSEYYPKKVKKAITGNGNAGKSQVAYMLEKILGIDASILKADATDALAVAWCHYTHLTTTPDPGNGKKLHQNNKKSSWSSFIADNPDRIRKGSKR